MFVFLKIRSQKYIIYLLYCKLVYCTFSNNTQPSKAVVSFGGQAQVALLLLQRDVGEEREVRERAVYG